MTLTGKEAAAMANSTRKDFFISYTQADREWAEWIAWHLEAHGYTTIIYPRDLRPNANVILEIDRATKTATRTIAVLSPDYLKSRDSQAEWAAAFAQDPTSEKGKLLPVRVRACKPKGLLSTVVYIDLVGLDEASAAATLLAGVDRGRAKPAKEPRFPRRPPNE
jgi:hypothetical protein